MGAGHLNANRAFQQFAPGEWDVDGTGDVPLIGWDYGMTDGIVDNLPDRNTYVFDQPLLGGSYVSITLAWDRVIELDDDANSNGEFDPGDTFTSFESPADPTDSFNNMDLWLMPKGSTDYNDAISFSFSEDTNVEHIFAEIPTTGEYEFWVEQFSEQRGPQVYAVAWWAAGAGVTVTGDYDGNGSVGPEDYDLWKADFGSMTELAADGNGDGIVDAADYTVWRDNLGAGTGSGLVAVPEPSTVVLLILAGVVVALRRSR